MDNEPKNVVLLLDGEKMKASIERGVKVPKRVHPTTDYAVSGYEIKQALKGETLIVVSFHGTEEKDYIVFDTGVAALEFLAKVIS